MYLTVASSATTRNKLELNYNKNYVIVNKTTNIPRTTNKALPRIEVRSSMATPTKQVRQPYLHVAVQSILIMDTNRIIKIDKTHLV